MKDQITEKWNFWTFHKCNVLIKNINVCELVNSEDLQYSSLVLFFEKAHWEGSLFITWSNVFQSHVEM